jgi:hypothetical protein
VTVTSGSHIQYTTNSNGFVGVSGVHSKIDKRYVVSNTWKDQDFKFIGKNGYWRLIYTKNPIDLSAAFYVRYLNGYNLELENSLEN